MALRHETDTAADIPDFFARLEAFLAGAGWTLVSGGGTTTIVYSSTGELGTMTKLFIRIWRGANPDRVYFRVQDDGAGTHVTGTGQVAYLTAPGAGAVPFQYWMSATKDVLMIAFKNGAAYTGCYLGLTEPFALNPPDETMYMVSVGLHTDAGSLKAWARVLQRYDNTWDYLARVGGVSESLIASPLDGSFPLVGSYVYNTGDNSENYGQLLYCVGRKAGAGPNAEDTITSGYPGPTSEWVMLGTGNLRWAFATSGPLPVGTGDGANWAYLTGVAGDIAALQAALEAFLTARGWTMADWPAPLYAIDRSFQSTGEAGADTICLRWHWDVAQSYWGAQAYDTPGGTHSTSRIFPGQVRLIMGDWPIRYYFSGDKDCFLVVLELKGTFPWAWYGMGKTFFPDPDSISTEYKVAVMNSASAKVLRSSWNGLWGQGLTQTADAGVANSGPNLIDGVTHVVWPSYLRVSGSIPWGTVQYLYRMSSTELTLGDTVLTGPNEFMYFGYDRSMKIA